MFTCQFPCSGSVSAPILPPYYLPLEAPAAPGAPGTPSGTPAGTVGAAAARISRYEGMEAHARTGDVRLRKYGFSN